MLNLKRGRPMGMAQAKRKTMRRILTKNASIGSEAASQQSPMSVVRMLPVNARLSTERDRTSARLRSTAQQSPVITNREPSKKMMEAGTYIAEPEVSPQGSKETLPHPENIIVQSKTRIEPIQEVPEDRLIDSFYFSRANTVTTDKRKVKRERMVNTYRAKRGQSALTRQTDALVLAKTENLAKVMDAKIDLTLKGRHITTIKEALSKHEYRAHLIEQARVKYLKVDDGEDELVSPKSSQKEHMDMLMQYLHHDLIVQQRGGESGMSVKEIEESLANGKLRRHLTVPGPTLSNEVLRNSFTEADFALSAALTSNEAQFRQGVKAIPIPRNTGEAFHSRKKSIQDIANVMSSTQLEPANNAQLPTKQVLQLSQIAKIHTPILNLDQSRSRTAKQSVTGQPAHLTLSGLQESTIKSPKDTQTQPSGMHSPNGQTTIQIPPDKKSTLEPDTNLQVLESSHSKTHGRQRVILTGSRVLSNKGGESQENIRESDEVLDKINVQLYDAADKAGAIVIDPRDSMENKLRSVSSSINSGSMHSGMVHSPTQRDSQPFFFRQSAEHRSMIHSPKTAVRQGVGSQGSQERIFALGLKTKQMTALKRSEETHDAILSDERMLEPAYIDQKSSQREILINKIHSPKTGLVPPSLPPEPITSYPLPIDPQASGSMTNSAADVAVKRNSSVFQPGKTVRQSDIQGTQSSVVNLPEMQNRAAMKIDITTENKPLKLSPHSHEKVSNLTSDVDPDKYQAPEQVQAPPPVEPQILEEQSSTSMDVEQVGEDLLYNVQLRQYQIRQKKAQQKAQEHMNRLGIKYTPMQMEQPQKFKIPTSLAPVGEEWEGKNSAVQADMARPKESEMLELSESMGGMEPESPDPEEMDGHDMISRINRSPMRSQETEGTGAPVTHSLQMVSISQVNEFRISGHKDQLNSRKSSRQGKSVAVSSSGMPKASVEHLSGDVLRGSLSAKSELLSKNAGAHQGRKPVLGLNSTYKVADNTKKHMMRTGTGALVDVPIRTLTPVGSDEQTRPIKVVERSAQHIISQDHMKKVYDSERNNQAEYAGDSGQQRGSDDKSAANISQENPIPADDGVQEDNENSGELSSAHVEFQPDAYPFKEGVNIQIKDMEEQPKNTLTFELNPVRSPNEPIISAPNEAMIINQYADAIIESNNGILALQHRNAGQLHDMTYDTRLESEPRVASRDGPRRAQYPQHTAMESAGVTEDSQLRVIQPKLAVGSSAQRHRRFSQIDHQKPHLLKSHEIRKEGMSAAFDEVSRQQNVWYRHSFDKNIDRSSMRVMTSSFIGHQIGRHGRASMPTEMMNIIHKKDFLQIDQNRDRLGAYLGNKVQMSNFSADPKQMNRDQSGGTLFLSETKGDKASNVAVANESAIQLTMIKSRHPNQLDDQKLQRLSRSTLMNKIGASFKSRKFTNQVNSALTDQVVENLAKTHGTLFKKQEEPKPEEDQADKPPNLQLTYDDIDLSLVHAPIPLGVFDKMQNEKRLMHCKSSRLNQRISKTQWQKVEYATAATKAQRTVPKPSFLNQTSVVGSTRQQMAQSHEDAFNTYLTQGAGAKRRLRSAIPGARRVGSAYLTATSNAEQHKGPSPNVTVSTNLYQTAISSNRENMVNNHLAKQSMTSQAFNTAVRPEDPYSIASLNDSEKPHKGSLVQIAVGSVPKPSRLHSATNSLKLRKNINPRTGLAQSVQMTNRQRPQTAVTSNLKI